MKKKEVHMGDLHYEYKLWKRQLVFEVDELEIFKHRLEEVVVRWTDQEVLKKVEHFQNAFIIQKEVLDTLLHDIQIQEDNLAEFAKEHPIASDHVHFKDHAKLRDSVEAQLKQFFDMKKEYMRFLTEKM